MKDLRSAQKDHPMIKRVAESDVPIADLIGFSIDEIGDGRAAGVFQAGARHANPMGTLHGGVLCDFTDAPMGTAFASTLEADESFTTLELKINFFRPVWEARLRAEAKVIQRGKTVGYIECDVTDEKGKLVAKASSTCLVLRGAAAKGR